MKTAHRIVSVSFAIVLAACAQKPTKTYTTADIDTLFMQKKLQRPIRVNHNTVLVDARPEFEFAMLHAPQAVHVRWADFTQDANSGALKPDLSRVTKRLALMGISPKSSVIVLSGGRSNWIDAGRVAWTLMYLGVPDVQVVDQNALGLRYYNTMPPPRKNVPFWMPQLVDRLTCSAMELKEISSGSPNPRVRVLEVGATPAALGRTPHIHMDWSAFYNPNGRPNVKVAVELKKRGLSLEDRIVVISDRGLRSAAVTYALTVMGFRNVGNCTPGLVKSSGPQN